MTDVASQFQLYPYGYTYKGKRIYLIWASAEDGKDFFVLDRDRRLMKGQTPEGVIARSGFDRDEIDIEDPEIMDFDHFWRALRGLKENRASYPKTCDVLLKGWNFLEDLARTFSREEKLKVLKSPRISKAYDKLFWGTHILRPEDGEQWHPYWSVAEIRILKDCLKKAWHQFPELTEGFQE